MAGMTISQPRNFNAFLDLRDEEAICPRNVMVICAFISQLDGRFIPAFIGLLGKLLRWLHAFPFEGPVLQGRIALQSLDPAPDRRAANEQGQHRRDNANPSGKLQKQVFIDEGEIEQRHARDKQIAQNPEDFRAIAHLVIDGGAYRRDNPSEYDNGKKEDNKEQERNAYPGEKCGHDMKFISVLVSCHPHPLCHRCAPLLLSSLRKEGSPLKLCVTFTFTGFKTLP